jgi:hypothetical protein
LQNDVIVFILLMGLLAGCVRSTAPDITPNEVISFGEKISAFNGQGNLKLFKQFSWRKSWDIIIPDETAKVAMDTEVQTKDRTLP